MLPACQPQLPPESYGFSRAAVVRHDEGVRITTLGPLAVDGRPVRGDRLAAVIRELVEARGRTVSSGWRVGEIED